DRRLCSGCAFRPRHAVPGFHSLDGVYKRLLQNPLSDGTEHKAEQPPLEGLAVAYDDYVNVGQTVGTAREVVGVAGCASPRVGISRRWGEGVMIGPVVVQAFPDATRAFGDVGLRSVLAMHPEVLISAITK